MDGAYMGHQSRQVPARASPPKGPFCDVAKGLGMPHWGGCCRTPHDPGQEPQASAGSGWGLASLLLV